MKNLFILLFFTAFAVPVSASWQYTISNYSKQEYGAGNQNWQITQHPNGWMYIANRKGLLEFDGVYWNCYSFKYTKMRAVKTGKDNYIYAGGLEQFGYYVSNNKGELIYFSLSDMLPKDIKIGVIWNIDITDDNSVYFTSNNAIFHWKDKKLSTIGTDYRIVSSTTIGNTLYVFTNQGLMELNDDKLTPISGTSHLGDLKIVDILPTRHGLLLISSRNGLYFFNDGQITPYQGTASRFIESNQIFCAAMNNEYLALGSVQNGILLIHLDSDEIEHITIDNGLQNKTALKLYFDKDDNLWAGLDNGIDCIHLNSPILSICKSKMIGSGYSACVKEGNLYLGTNQGLYHAEAERLTKEKELDIRLLPGTEGQVWSVRHIQGDAFCNSDNGLFVLNGGKAEKIKNTLPTWNLLSFNNKEDVLIGGTYSGLYVVRKENGTWRFAHRIAGFSQSCKTMLAEDMGNSIWIANSEYGVCRLHISDDLKNVENIKNYNSEKFPIQGNICISRIDNSIVLTSVNGLYRYNQLTDSLEVYKELEDLLDGKTHYTYIKQDEKRNIWYVANGTLKLVRYNPKEKVYEKNKYESYLSNSLIEDFEDIYFYHEDEILVGTEDGFSLINAEQKDVAHRPVNLQIRKVYNTTYQDSLIYGKSFTTQEEEIVLPYSHNSLRMEYSTSIFDPLQNAIYSWRLLGNEKEEWSEYSKQTMKDFTHLREGQYTFEVRAITNSSLTPAIASFTFRIKAPWYRSIWAYILYGTLFILLIYSIWQRIQENRKLLILQKEQEILQKELEFKQENEIKDKKIDSLQEENLKAELRHKTAELVNSTLNLTRKNEILREIKKEVIHMGNAINDADLPSLRRKNLRLINKIDVNLGHDSDMDSFQTNFDALHHGFISILESQFPGLNKKEKMLCVYIRMNMISKEIAPLLNLSTRGVEITRYRLRKKLNLGEKDNLYEFLQKITAGKE
ncbi:triple tyrosine motif-containing protein [Bacteroides sp. 51]|uniref:ligand-binding sensor domain-containing protein n=1 Tax=Bacteroides sp. 51 TaxID=2302938 RepID=UPI0013D19D59|nr:triple tyrosine motif-containing protein [Bacteroides sp. 51]NDV83116.1 transcriptional regulator [Bacteroides sp. 51]